MLRSSASFGVRHCPQRLIVMTRYSTSTTQSSIGPCKRLASSLTTSRRRGQFPSPIIMRSSNPSRSTTMTHWRALSSESNNNSKGEQKAKSQEKGGEEEEEDMKEIVLTPGQKVVAASRLGMWAGIFAFGCACAYYIAKELLPTKMSPNSVFNGASKVVRDHPQVIRQYGDKLKFYGKDHGGKREGRRNFVEHNEYTSPDDGTKRTRVRFNLEGQFASAFCFAEVSSDMPSGEFVYVLVQDKRSGRVITVVDNRASLTAKKLAGGNQDTANAMQQLLGGGNKRN